jgi:hypothetical protein
MEIPYTKKEIAAVGRQLNEQQRKRHFSATADELMTATLDAIFIRTTEPDESGYAPNPEHKEEAVRRRRPFKFAELLEAAAKRGDNNDFFAGEVSRRLHSEDDKPELVHNLHTLLVIAEKEKDSHWQGLKREAFQMLKDDPILAERVFNHTVAQHRPPKVFILETTLPDQAGNLHPAAFVVLHHQGVDYSAPMLDTGDSVEKAREGAILSFFRHYGALVPYEGLKTPKLIDLALGRARVKRGDRLSLLKKICGADFKIEELHAPVEDDTARMEVTLRITKLDSGEKLEKTRKGWGHFGDDYLDKCAKDMIEDYRFVDMLAACDRPMDTRSEPLADTRAMIFSRLLNQGIDRRGPAQR